MAIEILMPALSPTMEEGTLAKWFVKEGDKVEPGDLLAEIETDKATMEFEAVEEGIIEKLLVTEGTEGVEVNSAIATLIGEENLIQKNWLHCVANLLNLITALILERNYRAYSLH